MLHHRKQMDWKIWMDSWQLPSFWVLPACLAIVLSDHGHSMTASRLDFNSFTCMHTLWIWWWFVQPASSTLSHVKKYLFEVKKVFNWVIDNKEGAERCAYFWKQLWCEDFGKVWCSYSFLMLKFGFFGQFTFKNTQLAHRKCFLFLS